MSDKALRDITHPSPAGRGKAHRCLPSGPGLRLCPTCLARARRGLRALPGLYEECAHAMNPAPRPQIREKVSGSTTPHAVNEAAVEARAKIRAVLASWAALVIDERRLTRRGDDVGRLGRLLTDHLDWLAAHPGAADFAAELDDLVATALRVIDTSPARRIDLGSCIVGGCAGRLVARTPAYGGTPQVGCDTGRHSWRPDQWLLLRRRLDRARLA